MTSRGHALVLSLGLGAATATGAWAAMSTSAIRGAESKPEIVSQREIDARARKLDAWQASLAKSLHARPPKLPAVVRYPRLAMATAPANAALPTPNAPVARAQTEARQRPVTQTHAVVHGAVTTTKRRTAPAAAPTTRQPERGDEREAVERQDEARPATPVVTTAPTPAPVVPAAAPPPAPVTQPAQQPATTTTTQPAAQPLSVEQQCRQLLRAAEGKGEQAKKLAEQQCEALKQAAEKKG